LINFYYRRSDLRQNVDAFFCVVEVTTSATSSSPETLFAEIAAGGGVRLQVEAAVAAEEANHLVRHREVESLRPEEATFQFWCRNLKKIVFLGSA
jgi:hypothetical protein